jgi:hypothetical protein
VVEVKQKSINAMLDDDDDSGDEEQIVTHTTKKVEDAQNEILQ